MIKKLAAEQLATSGPVTRLIGKIGASPRTAAVAKAFKAFATFSAKPVMQNNLRQTEDGLRLKNIKVAPFFFKQFTVKEGKP